MCIDQFENILSIFANFQQNWLLKLPVEIIELYMVPICTIGMSLNELLNTWPVAILPSDSSIHCLVNFSLEDLLKTFVRQVQGFP